MKFNRVKRDLFVAEMQSFLGGSENARNDMIRLIRYSTSHHRMTLSGDKEGRRKVERLIRNLLASWYIAPIFEQPDDPHGSTVFIRTTGGAIAEVPWAWSSREKQKPTHPRAAELLKRMGKRKTI